MSSKKKSVSSTIIALFFAWILVEGYLKPIPALASSAKETHSSRETGAHVDEAHGEKEDHRVEGHGEEAAHEAEAHGEEEHGEEVHEAEAHGEEEHGEESWWRFSGWQIVFAVIGCLYFVLVLAWLPKLVAKKGVGGGH
jgi:hypothetical protein